MSCDINLKVNIEKFDCALKKSKEKMEKLIKIKPDDDVPQKFRKKIKTKRWEYIIKGEYIAGIKRKSTQETIFFNKLIKIK